MHPTNTRRRTSTPLTRALLSSILALAIASPAWAASITGTVRDGAGSALSRMQIRLYRPGPKGLEIAYETVTNTQGAYSFTDVAEGAYKLHARMAPGVTGNYSDRWYDVEEPSSDGWIAADADTLDVAQTDLSGVDMVLLNHGGFNGTVTAIRGLPRAGVLVRVVRQNEPRIHHNDATQASPHQGKFYIRGLVPGDYHVIAHDPEGLFDTAVDQGPHVLVANTNGALPTIGLSTLGADPHEPNDSPTDAGATVPAPTRDAPFTTSGAFIGPRRGDIDTFCIDAEAGQRFIAFTTTPINLGELTIDNPFVDPVLALRDDTGVIDEDDDSAKGYNALLDTGEITEAARLCFVVSTYGDTAWDATGQQSAGRYELTIRTGNRRPTIAGFRDGAPVTPTIELNEGFPLTIEVVAADPDNDPLSLDAELLDANNDRVNLGTFDAFGNRGTFSWEVGETAADAGPYTLNFYATDNEYTAGLSIDIDIIGINRRPSPPVHVFPEDGSLVPTPTVGLSVQNAVDPDGDPLTYEFQLFYESPTGTPVQSGTIEEDPSGQTTFTPTEAIPENTTVYWRVRAFDVPNNNSFWTNPWSFTVDSANEAPAPPSIAKPANGEIVIVRDPAITNVPTSDPEGSAIEIVFEVSDTADFANTIARSTPVPQPDDATGATWTTDVDLDFGGTYFVRAYAQDAFGAISEPGPANSFRIKAGDRPTPAGVFGEQCNQQSLEEMPTEFRVINVATADPSATIELQIFATDVQGEATDEPVIATSVSQNTGSADITVIPIDNSPLQPDALYIFRVRSIVEGAPSEWSECSFRVTGRPDAGEALNSQGDCACALHDAHPDAPALPLSAALAALLGGLLVIRRRRP